MSSSGERERENLVLRVGIGVDVHRFSATRPLVLGGVRVRDHDGLEGHSDADVLTHAIMDAILGAAGLGDIGILFPDVDSLYRGADSLELLAEVVGLVRSRGWKVVNVDAVVICEEPRIASYRLEMQTRLAGTLGLEPDRVGVKGTTTEGMGFAGRGEGIAAQAVALVMRNFHGEREKGQEECASTTP